MTCFGFYALLCTTIKNKVMKATINLYRLNELQIAARDRAIEEHGQFLNDDVPIEFEDGKGNLLREYHEHTTDEIIYSIEANGYLFFADGELAHITQYCGKHPKAGKIELKFHGEVIPVTE